jgi:hypothetical protein
MNTDELKLNEPYKYIDLCKTLAESKTQGGRNRKLQLKRWATYFEFEKKGQTYIVTKLKKPPLINRTGGSQKFKSLKLLLIDELNFRNPAELSGSMKMILNQIKIDDHFKLLTEQLYAPDLELAENYLKANSNFLKLKKSIFNSLVMEINQKLKELFSSALNSLKQQGLISFAEGYFIEPKLLANRFATPAETKLIKATQKEELKQLAVEYGLPAEKVNYFVIAVKNDSQKFYNRVNETLLKKYDFSCLSYRYSVELIKRLNPENQLITEEKAQLIDEFKTNLKDYFTGKFNKPSNSEWGEPLNAETQKEIKKILLNYFFD